MKKFVIGLTVVAMALVAAGNASAQTMSVEQLMAQIAQLQSLVAQLQGGTTAPAATTYTRDLTVGSTGADVTALQTFLESKGMLVMPAGVAKGYFGSTTKAALARYQASVALPATGYFGPLTRANVNSLVVVPPTTGGNTGTTGGTTTLEGDEGDITVTEKTSGLASEVAEGDEGAKVLGFEIEADGSDVAINSVKLTLEHRSGDGSTRLERYIQSVDVMLGDEVIGSADVDDFSKSGTTYTETIRLDNAIVRDGEKERFNVAVNVNEDVDSTNLSDIWRTTLSTVRFEDGSGVVTTDSNFTVYEDFSVESLTTAKDVELTLSEDDTAVNNAETIKIDATTDQNDVEIMSFKLKAEESDISLLTIPFQLTSTGAGVMEIANDFRLLMEGDEVGTLAHGLATTTLGTASTTATTYWVVFQDLDDDDIVIEDGDTVSFTLVADINDTDGNFGGGETLLASLNADNITAEDQNGDTVGSGVTKGIITTEADTFSLTSASVTGFRWDPAPSTGTRLDFFFTVTADDDDFDVLSSSIASTTSGTATTSAGVLEEYSGDDASSTTGGFTVGAGNTTTFRVRYTISGSEGTIAEVKITSVAGQTVSSDKQKSPTAEINLQ